MYNKKYSFYDLAIIEGNIEVAKITPFRDEMRAFQTLAEKTIKHNGPRKVIDRALKQAAEAVKASKSKRVMHEHNNWRKKHNFQLLNEEI